MPDLIKKCRISGKEFVVTEWEQSLIQKMGFPLPDLCPEERLKRRVSYRNERNLYKDVCDLTGKPIISVFSPEKPYKVYSQEAWWSDKWDSKDYGVDFDFSRGFFDQFHELQLKVPRMALLNTKGENSEYCNYTASNKNCYLVFGGDFNEDCMYSVFNMYCTDCLDTYFVDRCELCYECIDCYYCYSSKYMQDCHNCRDSAFLFDCWGCQNCTCCFGLKNKKYHVFNKAYSKEEYEKIVSEFALSTWSGVVKSENEFAKFKLKFPHRYAKITNCENVTGDSVINAKNCANCFDIFGPAEDLKDSYIGGWNSKDVVSSSHFGHKCEMCYEIIAAPGVYNAVFCVAPWEAHDVCYCETVTQNSNNLLGCVGMKKASYCIFNKQYSESEYFSLRGKIVGHMKKTGEWGQFFPMKYSPYCYNETIANDIYPLSKAEAVGLGLKWLDEKVEKTKSGFNLPNSIDDVDDGITEKALVCEKTGRPYRINDFELAFYRKMRIPVPRFAPETRNRMRFSLRNPPKIWERNCAKCGAKINSSYNPERPEIVYCEKCYLGNS